MIDTNIKGLTYVTRALLSGMVENSRGHVINMGSIAGRYNYPGGNTYGATKVRFKGDAEKAEGLRRDQSLWGAAYFKRIAISRD